MDRRTVLLVEDNKKLNEINRRALENKGYEVLTAFTLAQARERLVSCTPDVILLDVMLPDGNGFQFCREIRGATDAHIIFLTSRAEEAEQLRGLEFGGDDYITKPFKLEMLIGRVQSVMRRRGMTETPSAALAKGNLRLDALSGRAFINETDILLQPKEFAVLNFFFQNEGKTVSAEAIYESVWGQPMGDDKSAVIKRVHSLRSKLTEGNCDFEISNVYGKGYRFEKKAV